MLRARFELVLTASLGVLLGGCPQSRPVATGDDAGGQSASQDGGTGQACDPNDPDCLPSLALVALLPERGPASGGTQVVISGRGMREGVGVAFQGQPAQVVRLLGSSTLVVAAPRGATGAADVVVSNPDGRSATLAGGYVYENDPPPAALTLTRAVPATGSELGGEPVVLVGTGFLGGTRVFFGTTPAAQVDLLGPDVLAVVTPAAPAPSVAISVENPDGSRATLTAPFRFVAPPQGAEPLTLASVVPAQGPSSGGTRVALVGTGFKPDLQVTVAGVAVPVPPDVRGSRVVLVMTPRGAVGPATITVTQPGDSPVSLPEGFLYTDDRLGVSELVPASGPREGGDTVAIVGTGFRPGASVSFGSAPSATVVFSSDILLQAVTPAAAVTGPVDVTVTLPDGATSTLLAGYTYTGDRLALSELRPSRGLLAGGTPVALVGAGFRAGLEVLFGERPAVDVVVRSPTTATALTPVGTPGAVDVRAQLPDGSHVTLALGFTYDAPPVVPLALTSVTPNRGPLSGGVPVVLGGTGLDRVTDPVGGRVLFGGVEAEVLETISPESLVVRVPASAAVGAVEVAVVTAAGARAALPGAYTYESTVVVVAPQLTGIVPRTGPTTGGTRVALHGSGLDSATLVRVGGTPATGLLVLGPSVLSCTVPAGAPGVVDVTVVVSSGAVTLRRAFFYYESTSTTAGPTLVAISPGLGPVEGGTPFVLSGARFDPGLRVLLGGEEALSVRRLTAGSVTAVSPPATAPGTVDVVVMHPDGKTGALNAAFTYYDAPPPSLWPRIDDVTPPTASSLGGTPATMTGENFRDGVAVLVDNVPATDVVAVNASRVTFRCPPHAPGAAVVTAVNADGTYFHLDGGLTYVAQAPTLTEVIPGEGPTFGRTGLTLRGAGFDPAAQVLVGGTPALETVVHNPSVIMALTPPGAEGVANVTVRNPGGLEATLAGAFRYRGDVSPLSPELTSVTPASGAMAGGTLVTLRGRFLEEGGTLRFGDAVAARVTVVDGTTATAWTPAHAEGFVDVSWVNPSGQSAVLRRAYEYVDTPVDVSLLGVSPSQGPATGGTPTVLAGSAFTSDAQVYFGGVPASSVVVLAGGFLSAVSPPHAPGLVEVTVTAHGVSSSLPAAFAFIPSPGVAGVSPAVGPVGGGTRVMVGGSNFLAGARVFFGPSASPLVEVQGSSLIVAFTPARSAGLVPVVVRNPDGQQAVKEDAFEFLQVPALTAVWPSRGPQAGGTRATLTGTLFRAGATVRVGAMAATQVAFVSETTLTAVMPAGPVGAADVVVVNPDGQEAPLVGAFTYHDDANPGLQLATCRPSQGHKDGGAVVQVDGAAFAAGARSYFGGTPATTGFMDPTRLVAQAPPHAPGAVQVAVTLPSGFTATRDSCFTYTEQPPAETPRIAAIQPAFGPTAGGADVVVTGDYFQDGAVVLVGGRTATSVTFVSATRLEARTPSGDVGVVDVVVTNPDGGTGIFPAAYTYMAPPVVTSVTPPEGPSLGGTAITVRGRGFQEGASLRVGGVLASNVVVVTETEITATTPAGTPGVADVTVVNRDGQVGTLPAAFAYTPPPVITHVDPTRGSTVGGQWVHVFGSGFRAGALVTFGVNASPQAEVMSGGELRARTPPGVAGTVAVSVMNPDGYQDTLPLAFTYVAPPTVLTISPTSGPTAGGTAITILGANFQAGAQVFLGLLEAQDVVFRNAAVLECKTPARTAGPAALTVRNPDGQEATVPLAFVYLPPIPPPVLRQVSPNFGPITGGALATLTGESFQWGASVFFGDRQVEAADVNVVAATQIRVRVPAGSAEGAVAVRVLNPDSQESVLPQGYTYLPALALPPLALHSITPSRSGMEGGGLATILGNGMAPDVRFFAVSGATSLEFPIVQYFSQVAVQVRFPAATTAGAYDLRAVLSSSGDQTTLANAVWYQDNNLTFTMRRGPLPNETRPDDNYVVSADFNKDGFNDVLVLRSRYKSAYLLNRGASQPGWFDDVSATMLNESDSDNYDSASQPLVADFTQDGWPDILTWRGYSNHLRMWFSTGNGKLDYNWTYDLGFGPNDWVVADMDGQDGPDLMFCTGGVNYWLRNLGVIRDGEGTIIAGTDGRPQWRGFERVTFEAIVAGNLRTPNEDTRGCDVADLDNDGDMDVVLGNAYNIASRIYLNDVSSNGRVRQYSTVDEFSGANSWGTNQITGSVSGGLYRAQITNVSDPYFSWWSGMPGVSTTRDRIQFIYRSYVGGPTTLRMYYNESDCGNWDGRCSQDFPMVSDGDWHTLDAAITDWEWINRTGDVYRLRFDFEGTSSLGTVDVDSIKFYRMYATPTFIDASGSAMFNFAGDVRALRAADVDNDGDQDIIFLNYNQDDFILTNTVDGSGNRVFVKNTSAICHDEACRISTSSPPYLSRAVTVSTGADRYGRMAGTATDVSERFLDINRDGCKDLMIWHEGDPWMPRFYLNKKVGSDCTGQFWYTPTDEMTPPQPTNPLRNLYQATLGQDIPGLFNRIQNTNAGDPYMTLTDLDGDGWLDMYQSFGSNQDRLYLRRPVVQDGQTYMRFMDKTFSDASGVVWMPRSQAGCQRVRAVDINEDGNMDVVMAIWGDREDTMLRARYRAYLNDGAGYFTDISDYFQHIKSRSPDVLAEDLNGDGHVDLVFINHADYYNNTPNQIYYFQSRFDVHGNFLGFEDKTSLTNLGSGGHYYARLNHVLALDVDKDGDKDLVFSGSGNDGYYRRRLYMNGGDPLGRGAPYFFDMYQNIPDNNDCAASTVVDFNRDSWPDLYVSRNGQNRLLRNNGLGGFEDVTGFYMNQVSDNSTFAIADRFSGSAYTDIFVVNYQQARRIHVARADYTMADLTDSNIVNRIPGENRGSHKGYARDFNGDGTPDVMMPGYQTGQIFYRNLGNATFDDLSTAVFPGSLPENTVDIAIADFDRDGDPDVFLCNTWQTPRLLLNQLIP